MIGVILFATLALLPPMLQDQMNYPVFTTGLVTAPRGFGAMLSMILVSRIIGKIDTRLIIVTGLCFTAIALWHMTQFNLLMSPKIVIVSGILQGIGIGFCFITLSTIAFGTLSAQFRNEGAAFFNLMRNIGSSIGISVVEALLVTNTQIVHANLAENITPYNLTSPAYAANNINPNTTSGLLELNEMITNQAAMIAYNNDFKLMMVVAIALMPFVLLLHDPHRKVEEDQMAVLE